MKQILFRGKRNCGRWIEGSLLTSVDKQPAIYFEIGIIGHKSFDWVYVDPSTVGQYTTIDDKNGNKIFKDHIVKRESMAPGGIDFIGTVVFREGAYLLVNGKDCIPLFTEIDTLEIIGNIHDNKDLISTQYNP